MALRETTKRRLRWALIAGSGVMLLAVTAYIVRSRYLERRAVADRDAGLKLLAAGDYYQAMHAIGQYVRRHPDDAATLFAYARARELVPEPDHKHIKDAISLLRRVISLKPDYVQAAQELLVLYRKCGMASEELQLAKRLLAIDQSNSAALKAQAFAVFALGSAAPADLGAAGESPAVTTAKKYQRLWPDDLEINLLMLQIKSREGGAAAALASAQQHLKERPGDAAAQLLVSEAQRISGNSERAKQSLRQVPVGQISNAFALAFFVSECDALNMFREAESALRTYAKRKDGAAEADGAATNLEIRTMLAGRLWQLRAYEELADRFDSRVVGDGQVPALRCLALQRLGRREQAEQALAALKRMPSGNTVAKSWAAIVEALFTEAARDDAAIINAAQLVLHEDENNSYVRLLLCDAYQRNGQTADSIELLKQLIDPSSPSYAAAWAEPRVRAAELSVAAGHAQEGATLAQQALDRLPQDPSATLALAAAKMMMVRVGDKPAADEVINLLSGITSEPRTVPLRVQALARSGRKPDALTAARAVLHAPQTSTAEALMQLALVSQQEKLDIEQECLDRCAAAYGMSPDLAFWNAKRRIELGHKPDGLALLEKAHSASVTPTASAEAKQTWDTVWAKALEMVGDERAAATWIAFADGYPKQAPVQWMAMGMRSASADRAFVRRALDRTRDQSITWRIAQAKWLMQDLNTASRNNSAVEAALILNDVTRAYPRMLEPRRLLALCLDAVGNKKGAIDQLTAAANLPDAPPDLAMDLAARLEQSGDASRARVYREKAVEAAANSGDANQCRRIARLVAQRGDYAGALKVLEKAYGGAISEPPADPLLADLYWKTRQNDRAAAVCAKLRQTNDFASLVFVASFDAAEGRADDARAIVHRIDALLAQPAAMPGEPTDVKQVLRVKLFLGDFESALKVASAAQARFGGDGGFPAFMRQAPIAKERARYPELTSFLAELLDAPEQEPLLKDAAAQVPADASAIPAAAVDKLRSLATSNPKILWLQMLAVRATLGAGRADDAAAIAMQAANALPDAAPQAQFAATTLASAQKWREVLEMARRWRDAAPYDTLAADQMIAAAYIAQSNPAAAREQLAPHIEKAKAEPAKYRALIVQYAQLQALVGAANDAAALLRPLLGDDAGWRIDWMTIAARTLEPTLASAWLNEVDARAMSGAAAERLAFAECWQALAMRSGSSQFDAHAREVTAMVSAAAEREAMSPDAALSLGCLHEQHGDMTSAEKYYRKALAFPVGDPRLPIAQNNLAMLLAQKDDHLDEALQLAQQAAASKVESRASFLDTLAFVQSRRRDYVAGIAAIQEALAIRPDDPRFQGRLAMMLVENHQPELAKPIVEKLTTRPNAAPREVQQQIQQLQARLAKDAS